MFKKVLPIVIVILSATTVISCIMIANTLMRINAEIEDFEKTEDGIIIYPHKPELVEDPSLIIY